MTTDARDRPDDAGSMPLAMLITVVGVLLSGVLSSMVTVQMHETRTALKSQAALEAAQTGLDVALGQIRVATDGTESNGFDDNGVLAKLPCGPLIGPVGVGGTATYTLTIVYTSTLGGAPIPCHGTKGPAYATLVSKGTAADVTRTLRATYAFRTTNQNIAGGLMRIYKTATSKDFCLHANGNAIVAYTCSAGSANQTFAYNNNLTITLVSTITDSMPLGKCIDAGSPHGNNAAVTLQPCGTPATLPRQQWSFNDTGNLEGTADGANTDGFCLNVQSPDTLGSPVILKNGTGCGQSYNNFQAFNPDPAVGAGAAGPSSGQLVNYRQFGRCLDVPGQDYQRGYLTGWPCKQKPNSTLISWNQKWSTPTIAAGASSANGKITTKPAVLSGGEACITSPGTTGSTAYPRLYACPAVLLNTQKWTVYGDTGNYNTSYTIVDYMGNCMAAADPDNPTTVFHTSGNKISRAIMVPCSGSTFEKWNADPFVLRPKALTRLSED